MTKLLLKLPWFLSAPVIILIAAGLATGANLALSDYFERSFLDEASPLAASGSNTDTVGDQSPGDDSATPVMTPTAFFPSPAAGGQPNTPSAAPTAPVSEAGIILQGEWQDGDPGHNGSGVAQVIRTEDGSLVLRVEEFSVTNGPDLFVVLSPDEDGYADGSLTLGDLKATDGNFNYDIPAGTDLSQYKSVVVWCRSFNIDFAYATLEDV